MNVSSVSATPKSDRLSARVYSGSVTRARAAARTLDA